LFILFVIVADELLLNLLKNIENLSIIISCKNPFNIKCVSDRNQSLHVSLNKEKLKHKNIYFSLLKHHQSSTIIIHKLPIYIIWLYWLMQYSRYHYISLFFFSKTFPMISSSYKENACWKNRNMKKRRKKSIFHFLTFYSGMAREHEL
jgi:hypothetical protein